MNDNDNQTNQTSQDAPEVDPILTNDQSETKPGLPLLPPGNYRVTVKTIEQVRNSKDTGNLIKIALALMDDGVSSVSGEAVHPGFPLYTQIPITPTPNYSKESIDKALKTFMLCTGVGNDSGPGKGPFFPLTRFVGQVIPAECCKVKVTKETDDWPEKNEVRFVVPKGSK